MADWHTCIQRSQQLATTLGAMGHRCFYLNPHIGREFPNTYFRSPRLLLSELDERVFELHVHLWREPVFHHRCLRSEESGRIVDAISDLLIAARSSSPALIVSFPLWEEVALELRRRFSCPIIYDCHDLLSGFNDISEDLLAAESRFLTDSDLVVCSAEWLLDHTMSQHASIRGKAVLIRNGVHQSRFRNAVRQDNRNRPGAPRTVGYVGILNFWFDPECVRRAAVAHPEWRFLLVGAVATHNVDSLKSLPNVVFRGEVQSCDLASCLAEMDIGIIPFAKCPLTFATNPIKLYEYFACGLPVVSTRLPELEQFPGLTYLADGPEEFVLQLENAMREDDPARRARRIHVAQTESWSARCRQLIEEISRIDSPVRVREATAPLG